MARPGRPERNRAARSFRQLRRFHHGINSNKVFGTHTAENDQLNEARVKFITSQDTITARNLYGHFFDFAPTHETFLTTNHKPVVRGTDEGIWRRVNLTLLARNQF